MDLRLRPRPPLIPQPDRPRQTSVGEIFSAMIDCAESSHLRSRTIAICAWPYLTSSSPGRSTASSVRRCFRNSMPAPAASARARLLRYLASDRERLTLAEATLRNQIESFELTRREAQIGFASDLSLREAQTTVETARVDTARYAGQIAEDINAVDLLVGTTVPASLLPRCLDEGLRALSPDIELPAGLPAELLERRPDVLEAERTLRAAGRGRTGAASNAWPGTELAAGSGRCLERSL
jgi:hypothetical protein